MESAVLRILSCIQPSILPLGEECRRDRHARRSVESDDTVIILDGVLDRENQKSSHIIHRAEGAPVTVTLLANAFAAGLLMGAAMQKVHGHPEAVMELCECSVPSFMAVVISGHPDAVYLLTVSVLGAGNIYIIEKLQCI